MFTLQAHHDTDIANAMGVLMSHGEVTQTILDACRYTADNAGAFRPGSRFDNALYTVSWRLQDDIMKANREIAATSPTYKERHFAIASLYYEISEAVKAK